MSMSKKDFIDLADSVKQNRAMGYEVGEATINWLADYCQSQNPRFNRQRWLDYIAGKCGPNGRAVK